MPPLNLSPAFTTRIIQLSNMSNAQHALLTRTPGLFLRPYIDWHNPDVNKETRVYSAVKTFVKVLIGLACGILVRQIGERYARHLVDKGTIRSITPHIDQAKFKQNVEMVVSAFANIISIFVLDLPFLNLGINFSMKLVNKFFKLKPPAPASSTADLQSDFNPQPAEEMSEHTEALNPFAMLEK